MWHLNDASIGQCPAPAKEALSCREPTLRPGYVMHRWMPQIQQMSGGRVRRPVRGHPGHDDARAGQARQAGHAAENHHRYIDVDWQRSLVDWLRKHDAVDA